MPHLLVTVRFGAVVVEFSAVPQPAWVAELAAFGGVAAQRFSQLPRTVASYLLGYEVSLDHSVDDFGHVARLFLRFLEVAFLRREFEVERCSAWLRVVDLTNIYIFGHNGSAVSGS
jgi:hypothetical protein